MYDQDFDDAAPTHIPKETVCPLCKVTYPTEFGVDISIKSVWGKSNKMVIGGHSSEFDCISTLESEWMVISKDVSDIDKNICAPCIRSFIDQGKIVNCYKCNKRYKDYIEFRNRFVVNFYDKKGIYKSRESTTKYKIDDDDCELIERKGLEYRKDNTFNGELSICKMCLKNTKRRNKIIECDILPIELCDLIYEYTPELLVYECKLCNYKIESSDVRVLGVIWGTNVRMLDYIRHLVVSFSGKQIFKNLASNNAVICRLCTLDLIDQKILN